MLFRSQEASDALAVILDGAEPTVDYQTALANLNEAITITRTSITATRNAATTARGSIDGLHQKLLAIGATAQDTRSELTNGPPWNRSITAQSQKLADELCELGDGGVPMAGELSAADVERLRSYLTDVPCNPTNADGTEAPALKPPFGFQKPLDVRLSEQTAAWDAVLAAVDTTAADQEIGEAFAALEATITDTEAKLAAIDEAEIGRAHV